jgi:hypothetical protein
MKATWIVSIGAALLLGALPMVEPASAALLISVRIGPPLLPVYEQPAVPAGGCLDAGVLGLVHQFRTTTGFGTWVLARGAFWTPAYWAGTAPSSSTKATGTRRFTVVAWLRLWRVSATGSRWQRRF